MEETFKSKHHSKMVELLERKECIHNEILSLKENSLDIDKFEKLQRDYNMVITQIKCEKNIYKGKWNGTKKNLFRK